jgi:putative oxidoreductase
MSTRNMSVPMRKSGVAVVIPRFSIIGAGLLLFVDVGAFVAQITVLHMDWIHTVVVAALLVLLIPLQRKKLDAAIVTISANT